MKVSEAITQDRDRRTRQGKRTQSSLGRFLDPYSLQSWTSIDNIQPNCKISTTTFYMSEYENKRRGCWSRTFAMDYFASQPSRFFSHI
jgi:hypothetical protein